MVLRDVDPGLLAALDSAIPRYTSYPTAPVWGKALPGLYEAALKTFDSQLRPLSLYVHIPFCKTMCLFCGCGVILNRREDIKEEYVDYLLKEARLVSAAFKKKHPVTQLHLGGGTPTQLTKPQMKRLVEGLEEFFEIDGERSIEVDPRTVNQETMPFLKELKFNRLSFGVQDTDPNVQKAVRRNQSLEMTEETVRLARKENFSSINVDLIYGLPLQTEESFKKTVDDIIALSPDRIALFSYAKVPWLKAHQKAIPESSLPTRDVKFALYAYARKAFIDSGYVAIGMDHFSKKSDELALAFHEKKLQRNFQGYSLKLSEDLLGLGVTSISSIGGYYLQNEKTLAAYYECVKNGSYPLHRGYKLTEDDLLRRFVIHTLMCDFELNKQAFFDRFQIDFNRHFEKEIAEMPADLVNNEKDFLRATPLGSLFIRNIAFSFDAYKNHGQFSKAI